LGTGKRRPPPAFHRYRCQPVMWPDEFHSQTNERRTGKGPVRRWQPFIQNT